MPLKIMQIPHLRVQTYPLEFSGTCLQLRPDALPGAIHVTVEETELGYTCRQFTPTEPQHLNNNYN